VVAAQRTSSALKLNPHVHAVFLDGVYRDKKEDDMKKNGARPTWLFYVGVDDVDATAKKVEAAGGTLLMQPFDIPGAGRAARLDRRHEHGVRAHRDGQVQLERARHARPGFGKQVLRDPVRLDVPRQDADTSTRRWRG
jgi:hypothetical protein